jgi:hypothetical protein
MLLIATVLFSNKGHEILTSGRRSHFGQNDGVMEWTILVVETLLMWEEWLKSNVFGSKRCGESREKASVVHHVFITESCPSRRGYGLENNKIPQYYSYGR